MSFNTFCNICFTKDNIIKLCGEENEQIFNILIAFTSSPDIVNGIIYLCINCCNKLEEYHSFRELCLTNFVQFRYLYKEHRKKLALHNTPDIEIKLKAFVDVNVERPSGTPLIENYEAEHVLRNNTTCNIGITSKQESGEEILKGDLDELLNKNDLSHVDTSCSAENDEKIFHEINENYSFPKDQEINVNSAVIKNELNPERLEESQDPLLSDTVLVGSPCYESAVDNTFNVSFKAENCETDDGTQGKGYTEYANKTVTSASVCNVFDEKISCNSDVFFIDVNIRTHTSDKYCKCHKCHKTFTDTAKLKIHKGLHSAKRPYKCDECGLRFTKSFTLGRHKLTHTGEKPYKCVECGLGFTQQSNLNTHKRRHTGEKPFKCDECGLGFTQRVHLNTHKRTHTGEKPYKCDECSLGFTQRSHLNKHKRIHTGEKPYKCDECDYRCRQRSSLNKHKRKHTGERPYKCDECDYRCTQRSRLQKHKCIDPAKKPYKCDECHLGFSNPSNLGRHKRTHTGEKPYKCDECSLRFADGSNLRRHKRRHTSEKPYKCASVPIDINNDPL